jgi:prepilin-type N-terminal cleavage/methylation domain-containing protein
MKFPIKIKRLKRENNGSCGISDQRGFSFVEIMVAAALISVMIVAVIAMVRKGSEWIPLNRHMRFARGIIASTMEKQAFQPENYNNCVAGTTTTTEILDPKTNLQGTFTFTINAEVAQVNGVAVPHKEITGVITWVEPGNPDTQTVRIVKWLTYLQH